MTSQFLHRFYWLVIPSGKGLLMLLCLGPLLAYAALFLFQPLANFMDGCKESALCMISEPLQASTASNASILKPRVSP